ncbi:hypothetical protein [Chitinophaga sp. sic0106]|uniref:hypothetical protein n=1 Tax=Chitinophaga sp. sic0106 TaxID=2854785 RepID=UPI001C470BE4|nr:hypothetical protein [Chitinophaga sp. sic0106]MBV7533913.1 hypothetical protein [Chitinophaga sp. sic0106]
MIRLQFILLLTIGVLPFWGYGQVHKDTVGFRAVYELMQRSPDMRPYAYDALVMSKGGGAPDTMAVSFFLGKGRMIMKTSETTLIINGKFRILLNHVTKEIYVKYHNSENLPTQTAIPSADLLLSHIANWELQSGPAERILIINTIPPMEIQRFVIRTDIKTGFSLQVAALVGNTDTIDSGMSQLVVTSDFKNYRFIEEDYPGFDEKQYIQPDGNSYIPIGKYKDYTLTFDKPN